MQTSNYKRRHTKVSIRRNFVKYVLDITVLLLISIVLFISYRLIVYTNNGIIIRGNKNVLSSEIHKIIYEDIKFQPMIKITTDEIEEKLTESFPIFKKVRVSKSIIYGYVVDIKEFEPVGLIILQNGEMYMLTDNKVLILLQQKIPRFPVAVYTGNPSDEQFIHNANKVFKLYESLSPIISGDYTFDNFGNLFILVSDEKVIRFDLNERFFKLDEQVKILESVLNQNIDYKEIDVRFNYLLVK
ncbi:MAG: hypothetical protein KatS3mg084_0080 [Candidatus Dojkabacteria bacterium]|nr:MAG: hypothetical protein KatS3mg084_0080 [Candidatus Dojkabacteria bacterium]